MPQQQLVIDRRKWGTGDEGGMLLTEEGKMCCLGFFCRQAGYKPSEIIDKSFPLDVVDVIGTTGARSKRIACLITEDGSNNTSLAENLATVNDSISKRYNTLPKKEKRITELFKKIGVSVKFTN